MKITIESRCPLFPGFYNTIYEMDTDSVIYNFNEDTDFEVEYDHIDWDYQGYEKAVCKEFVSTLEPIIKEIFPAIEKMEFVDIESPREYNFTNDKIAMNVTYNSFLPGQIRKYLDSRADDWKQFLEAMYKSREGFMSFYKYKSDDWKECTQNYSNFAGDWNLLYTVLEFACRNNDNCDDFPLYETVMEGIYPDEFATLKGQTCKICGDSITDTPDGICKDCQDTPEYRKHLEKIEKWKALQSTPPLPGLIIEPVRPAFNPA